MCLVVNATYFKSTYLVPNPKAPSQFGGVLLASVPAHTSPRTRATTHTLHSGVHRSLGALLRAGAFGLASSMHWLPFSRGVTCASGVLSCRAFLFVTRDGAGARRMFQGVDVDVSSAMRLASLHAGFPVHVWRCRHPSPRGGWARCAKRPPLQPWPPRVAGGAATLDRVLAPRVPRHSPP